MLRSMAYQLEPYLSAPVTYIADFEYRCVERRDIATYREGDQSLSSLFKLVCGILNRVHKSMAAFAVRVHNSAILTPGTSAGALSKVVSIAQGSWRRTFPVQTCRILTVLLVVVTDKLVLLAHD
jgi:hypothetical protein